MSGIEGENTRKFQKLFRPPKTPWRSFKSMLSRTFRKRGNNGFLPLRHNLGAVYEKNLGSELDLNIPTNRGGLRNYMRNIDIQIRLLGRLKNKTHLIKNKEDRDKFEGLAKAQLKTLGELKKQIKERGVKGIANTMATEVKGTLLSPNGFAQVKQFKNSLNQTQKQQENKINSHIREANTEVKKLEKIQGNIIKSLMSEANAGAQELDEHIVKINDVMFTLNENNLTPEDKQAVRNEYKKIAEESGIPLTAENDKAMRKEIGIGLYEDSNVMPSNVVASNGNPVGLPVSAVNKPRNLGTTVRRGLGVAPGRSTVRRGLGAAPGRGGSKKRNTHRRR